MAEDGANLIPNAGFENLEGPATYSLFTAPESKDYNCRYTISSDTFHSGKLSALMQADGYARFAIGPVTAFPVVAGDCYRVGVWVKAGPDFQMQPGSPGVALRLNLTTGASRTPSAVGLMFIYLNDAVSQAGPPSFSPRGVTAPVPTQWTHIEAVVKVPSEVDFMGPVLFFWRAKGSLYVDDFSFQKVDPATPVTPILDDSSVPASL